MKYKFVGYYKYSFTVELENGAVVSNVGDADDIYRFDINAEGEAKLTEDGKYLIDGLVFS